MLLALFTALNACIILLNALPTPEITSGAASQEVAASAERFYDDNLETYVEQIVERIVDFNDQHETHHGGGNRHRHAAHTVHGQHRVKHHKSHPKPHLFDDSEEMQSDQPQPGGHQSHVAVTQQELLLKKREQDYQSPEDRDKLAMTNHIKQNVMSFIAKGNGTKSYGERDRSFYASCDQPKSTEENDDFMKLYFTLSQLEDTIASANLRLYRKSPINQTVSFDAGDMLACLPGASRADSSIESEKLYRVTLYYNVKGQKKHKQKRKIGDSKVMTDSMPYVNLNVVQGVRELNKGKLFGVLVQIEDQFGTVIKAADFLKGPTCTVGMPTPQPLPTVFEEAHANLGRIPNAADFIRKPVQPKLDIKTIQPPPDEDLSSPQQSSTRCRQVVRHALLHSSRPRPPVIDGTVITDMNELRQLIRRMDAKAKQQLQSLTAT